jgi:hypothetical protein
VEGLYRPIRNPTPPNEKSCDRRTPISTIITSHDINGIMTHSQWICNTCGESFETKGRRDGHRERTHRKRTTIGIDKRDVRRSEDGKFRCECGRDYMLAQSLQHHRRSCKKDIIKRNENGNEKEDVEEGIYSLNEHEMTDDKKQ